MKEYRLTFTGTTALLLHNVQLADPQYYWTIQLKPYTGKRKKTDKDEEMIAYLEWMGSHYYDGTGQLTGPLIKTACFREAIVEAAKITKQGNLLKKATILDPFRPLVPIEYDGPRDLEELYKLDEFRDRDMVRIGTSRVVRTRPRIPAGWQVTLTATLIDDIMKPGDFLRIAENSGVWGGVGDNRTNGYGKYITTVEEI